MKKYIFAGVLTSVTAVAMAFSMQTTNTRTGKRELPCTKFYLTCPSGIIYYKCVRSSAGEVSPDCYNVTSGPSNDGCNITLRPC